jgi:Uma2 family endonuclease
MTPAARRANYQDVLDAPPHRIAEIINGTLHVQPRPARRHTRIHSRLAGLLGYTFGDHRGEGHGQWVVLIEPELHLHGDILVPDLAGWRIERFDFENDDGAYYEVAPDWCCEILSPGTETFDRVDKSDIYLREGVRHSWLVDPIETILEAFERTENGRWLLHGVYGVEGKARIVPFDAIEMELAALWGNKPR